MLMMLDGLHRQVQHDFLIIPGGQPGELFGIGRLWQYGDGQCRRELDNVASLFKMVADVVYYYAGEFSRLCRGVVKNEKQRGKSDQSLLIFHVRSEGIDYC